MKYLDIILFKTWADLRSEASRAYIGFLWWFIEPVLYMSAFYLLFGLGLRMGGDNFVHFLLCGLIPWKWFSSSVSNGSRSIAASAGLINQVYLPKYILPTIAVLTNTAKFLVILPVLIMVLLIGGEKVSVHWFALILLILLQFFLIWSLASFTSAIVPFVPDLKYLIENGLLLLMFLSGVFFDLGRLDGDIAVALSYNPVALLLQAYRDVLLANQWPSVSDLVYVSGFIIVPAALSWWLFSSLDKKFVKVI